MAAEKISARISNIQKFCIHDGKGIRTTVFFKGCPLKCKWCSNPETQVPGKQLAFWDIKCISCGMCKHACPAGLANAGLNKSQCIKCFKCSLVCPSAIQLIGKDYTPEELIDIVSKDIKFYEESSGGVTLSGGEPLLQHDFVLAFIKLLKFYGFDIAIETSGFAETDTALPILSQCDSVLYDIKHMDPLMHQKFTGVDNEIILRNLKELVEEKRNGIVIRMPLIGGFNDDTDNIRETIAQMKALGLSMINILPYHDYAKSKYTSLGIQYDFNGAVDEKKVKQIQSVFLDAGLDCVIGG